MRTAAIMTAALRTLMREDLARYSTRGQSQVSLFEKELATSIGTSHALAVNSGTSALICALVAAGIGPGDEVLVPAYTWISTAAAPLAVGAVPVLVEIDESLTIDPADMRKKITSRSRAVIPVHMLNLASDMDQIMAIGQEHNLVVIEDACQAIGVSYRGRKLGSIGHAGAFSFQQNKNIKSGEGGAVVTNDERMHVRAEMYHDVGSYSRKNRRQTDEPLFIGVNFRMSELSGAILRPQLHGLDAQIRKRQRRRKIAISALEKSDCQYRLSHHNSPDEAVGLSIYFEDPNEARLFGSMPGAKRLTDTGRHIYTNWESVIVKRVADSRLNPYQWADRDDAIDEETCPRTLNILARTCSISVDPDLPLPIYMWAMHRIARARRSASLAPAHE